ncbi:MAG TPA: histidine phosphatase family protein [Rhizomicrobium sp.]|nr:histidine phosphatase family protein [Rhizomicrobium sp.]
MRRLLLLRHAKTEQINKDTPADRDRVLTERGRSDAPKVGQAMQHRGYLPDLILCSTSARTRQTLELAAAEFGSDIETQFADAIYDARASELLRLIQAQPDTKPRLLLVGHNPGFEDLAGALVDEAEDSKAKARIEKMEEKFPTSALAVIDFVVDRWRDVKPESGRLVDFIRPKDLD